MNKNPAKMGMVFGNAARNAKAMFAFFSCVTNTPPDVPHYTGGMYTVQCPKDEDFRTLWGMPCHDAIGLDSALRKPNCAKNSIPYRTRPKRRMSRRNRSRASTKDNKAAHRFRA